MNDARDITVTAEIPLGATAHYRNPSYNSDGELIGAEAVSILDAIIEGLVSQLKDALIRKYESRAKGYGGLDDLYDEKLKDFVEAKVSERISEQLDQLTQASTSTGEQQTLAAFIDGKVAAWLAEASRDTSYVRKSPTRLEAALSAVIDRETQKALDAAMAQAKTKALDAIAGVAQEKLAQALRETLAAVRA